MKESLNNALHSGNYSSREEKVISLAAQISGFTKAECRELLKLCDKTEVLKRTQDRFLQETAWFIFQNNLVAKKLQGKVEQDVLDEYMGNLYRYAARLDSKAFSAMQAVEAEWIKSGIYSATHVADMTSWAIKELQNFIQTGKIDFESLPNY